MCNLSGGSSLDRVSYGFLPHTTDLQKMSISIWFYPKAYNNFLLANYIDYGGGYWVSLPASGKLKFVQIYTGGADWTTDNTISLNQWHHVVITRDTTVISNPPTIYIDGSPVAITENTSPSGTLKTTYGSTLNIGNIKDVLGSNYPFNGSIMDVRIYNRLLSASEVTTLYNGGVVNPLIVTNGLQFQAFCIRCTDINLYISGSLSSENKLLDNIYGTVGTVSGNPTVGLVS
jgi:hypothetical protein